MSVEIKVPSVGESVTEGTIARWLKANGSAVKANEPVCELETDKATTEVMAPAAGTLAITVGEGQKVAIGSVIGRIESGAPQPARSDGNSHSTAAAPPAPNRTAAAPEPILSPSARQLVANEGIDPHQLTG